MKPKVIGLYSPAPASGKTAAAERLSNMHGYTHVKFAGALKYMLFALYQYTTGADNSVVMEYLEGKHKNTPIEWAGGKSMRQLMQTLGTEWGRTYVDPDVWMNITQQRIMAIVAAGGNVVVDDMRFENEFRMISELPVPTALVRVTRPHVERTYAGLHASEGKLEGMPFTHHIINDTSLAKLNHLVTELVRDHTRTPEKPK